LLSAGNIKCWGFNPNGQLGDGTTLTRNTPVGVSGAAQIKRYLLELPSDYRTVILLHDLAGLTATEMAALLARRGAVHAIRSNV
jgi:hypothetical protein